MPTGYYQKTLLLIPILIAPIILNQVMEAKIKCRVNTNNQQIVATTDMPILQKYSYASPHKVSYK